MAIPHMVIFEKCHGDVDITDCRICDSKGYVIVWETTLHDITDSGRARECTDGCAVLARQLEVQSGVKGI